MGDSEADLVIEEELERVAEDSTVEDWRKADVWDWKLPVDESSFAVAEYSDQKEEGKVTGMTVRSPGSLVLSSCWLSPRPVDSGRGVIFDGQAVVGAARDFRIKEREIGPAEQVHTKIAKIRKRARIILTF